MNQRIPQFIIQEPNQWHSTTTSQWSAPWMTPSISMSSVFDMMYGVAMTGLGFLNLYLWVMTTYTFCKTLWPRRKEAHCVTIVRGLPGSGKTQLVYQNEKDKDRVYSICDAQDFFYSKGKYRFDPILQQQSDQYVLSKLIHSMRDRIPSIYVVGSYSKTWQYYNYLDLAESFGYKTRIIEIGTPNSEYVEYFAKRSKHQVPLAKMKRLQDEWEWDYQSTVFEPFVDSFEGDSLPVKFVSVQQLDKEMTDYWTNGPEPVSVETSPSFTPVLIPYLSNEDAHEIRLQEVTKQLKFGNTKVAPEVLEEVYFSIQDEETYFHQLD